MRDIRTVKSGQTAYPDGQIPITKEAANDEHEPVAVEATDTVGSMPPSPGDRLGQILLAEVLITDDQLLRALDAQKVTHAPLGVVLVNQGAIQENHLTIVLSAHLDTPIADLKHLVVDVDLARLVPEDFARRNLVLPLRRDNGHLAIAMSDPSNLSLLNDLRLITGLSIAPYIA